MPVANWGAAAGGGAAGPTWGVSVSVIMRFCLQAPGSGVDGSDVDVNLPVAHQVAVEDQDVGVRHGDRLAVLAEVLHVDLRDPRLAGFINIQDVVGEAIDAGEKARDGLFHGRAPGDRVGVGEAERRVRGEVSDELVWVERVDVGEDGGYVAAHDALLRWFLVLAGLA